MVPSSLLKTEMQGEPHVCVAALAAPVAAALTPPTIVSVATAASTFLLIDSTWMDDEVMTDLLSEDLTGCVWWRHGACSSHQPRRARETPSPPPGLMIHGRGCRPNRVRRHC